jgi:hypothetical protein
MMTTIGATVILASSPQESLPLWRILSFSSHSLLARSIHFRYSIASLFVVGFECAIAAADPILLFSYHTHMSSSGGSSDYYLNKIKNETNRIKRRKQRVYEEHTPKQQQQHSQPEQSLSSNNNNGGKTGTSQRELHQQQQQQQQQQAVKNNNHNDHSNDGGGDDSDPFVLQPPDSRGESFSKIDSSELSPTQQHPKIIFRDPVPKRNMSSHLQAEHEAFRKKLIDDVLGDGASDRVPMEKVVMLIWQYRDDPQVVKFMTRFVAKVCSSYY